MQMKAKYEMLTLHLWQTLGLADIEQIPMLLETVHKIAVLITHAL